MKELYQNPKDTPRVNGSRRASHIQSTGLRQVCPLSPALYALCIDPLLHHLNDILASSPHSSMHAFADYVAIHSLCPKVLTEVLRFMVEHGEPFGLRLNVSKSEFQAWGKAAPVSLVFRSEGVWQHISTHNR